MRQNKLELAKEQLALMNTIREKANINVVTCGHCGTIILHEMKSVDDDFSITCFDCNTKLNLSDCPDLWYDEMLFNQYEPMKQLFETDYVIYDKANDNPLQDPYGRILIFGNPDEAFEDLYGNEIAIPCTTLPQHWQETLIKQINEL